MLNKIAVAARRIIDGHAPGLNGMGLTAYAAAGIMSDHECTTAEEAAEKLRRGLYIMIREGSQTRNLEALLPLITPATAGRFMFCTDDKDVQDLLDEGQIDYMIRTAIARGIDPILAVRLGSANTAHYFGLRQTAPSCRATAPIWPCSKISSSAALWKPIIAANSWRKTATASPRAAPRKTASSSAAASTSTGSSRKTSRSRGPTASARLHPRSYMSSRRLRTTSTPSAPSSPPPCATVSWSPIPPGILPKIVVIERHRATGEVGRAFVHGFGMKSGAIASSVAHDAHNIIVVGMSDDDMLAATVQLIKLHGGLVVVKDGKVLASVPLPIAGLVSGEPAEQVSAQLHELSLAARQLIANSNSPSWRWLS